MNGFVQPSVAGPLADDQDQHAVFVFGGLKILQAIAVVADELIGIIDNDNFRPVAAKQRSSREFIVHVGPRGLVAFQLSHRVLRRFIVRRFIVTANQLSDHQSLEKPLAAENRAHASRQFGGGRIKKLKYVDCAFHAPIVTASITVVSTRKAVLAIRK